MSTALLISFYFNCLFILLIIAFFSKRLKAGLLKDILINLWLFSFLMLNFFAVLEVYFRLIYDQSDQINFTKTAQRWWQRHVRLNKEGFRDREQDLKNPRSFRIAVLGDSFVLGLGIKNPEERFSNLLERRFCKEGQKVEVLNWGRGNWETKEELNFLEGQGRDYKIDFLILSYYLNDIAADSKLQQPPAHFLINNPYLAFFVGHSYALEFFYYRATGLIDKSMREFAAWQIDSYLDEPSWENHRGTLNALINFTKQKKIPLLVLVFPIMPRVNDYPVKYQQVHEKLKAFFQDKEVFSLDLLEEFKNHPLEKLVVSRYDAHPSSFANQLVAERLYQFFQDEGVIKK